MRTRGGQPQTAPLASLFTTGETGTLCSSGLGGLHFAWARGNGVRAQEPLAVLARSNKSTMDTHSNVHRGPGVPFQTGDNML